MRRVVSAPSITKIMSTLSQSHQLVRAQKNEVVVISRFASKDSIISYINLMRYHSGLKPLLVSPALTLRARRALENIQNNKMNLGDISRLQRNESLEDNLAWIYPYTRNQNSRYIATIPLSLSESPEYMAYILSVRCASVGISDNGADNNTKSLTVQIFKFGN